MELCRTCMNARGSKAVGDDFVSIFSHLEEENVYISECLTQWVGCTVDESDGLPLEICRPCLEAIKALAYFIQNARDCDKRLRKLVLHQPSDLADTKIKQEIKQSPVSIDEPSTSSVTFVDVNSEPNESNSQFAIKMLSDEEDDQQVDVQDEEDDSEPSSAEEKVEVKVSVKRKKRTRTGRKTLLERLVTEQDEEDELDSKELETFDVIEVEDKLICCGCFQLFDTEIQLELHGQMVHEGLKKRHNPINYNKKIVCTFCYKRFDSKMKCKQHREPFKAIKMVYACRKCNKRYINPVTRRNHAHNHKQWTVTVPKFFSVPIDRLEKHGYRCCVRGCTSSHSSEDALFEHVKKDHNLIPKQSAIPSSGLGFQCVFCSRTFDFKAQLDGHYIGRYTTVKFQCDQCGQVFKSRELLLGHENKHAQRKPFQCDICQKEFYGAIALKSHMKSHSEEKTFVCSICGMSFRTKNFLEAHYRVHSDAKPFQCDICSKAFRHCSSLYTHKRTHNPEKFVHCSVCDKGFADAANLKRHMVSHTGVKPYQCKYCEKRFMRLGERTEHESTQHLGVMPYSCSGCGREFSLRRSFQRHEAECGAGGTVADING